MNAVPLRSDLVMELDSGEMVALGPSFLLPPGLPGVGANDSGDRAPDSTYVTRSGDELPTSYSVTVPGRLDAADAEALMDALNELDAQLRRCRKLWRGERCFLPVAYGLLPQPEMGYGWLSARVTPVFRLSQLGWFTPDGRQVFG